MGRKMVKRKGDNLDKERSEEILASNTEWDVSNTLNYLQHIVNTIWLIWVYVKIILKLATFLFNKTKSETDEMASSVKTEDVPDSSNGLISLLKTIIKFFISQKASLFSLQKGWIYSCLALLCYSCPGKNCYQA